LDIIAVNTSNLT